MSYFHWTLPLEARVSVLEIRKHELTFDVLGCALERWLPFALALNICIFRGTLIVFLFR